MSVENPTTIKPYFRGVKGEADGTWYSIADKPSGTDVVKIETLMICNDRFDEMVVSLAIGSNSAYWMRSKIPAQCTLHVVSAEAPDSVPVKVEEPALVGYPNRSYLVSPLTPILVCRIARQTD